MSVMIIVASTNQTEANFLKKTNFVMVIFKYYMLNLYQY